MPKKEPKKIVFVCMENARRSQMAKGFAIIYGREKLEIYSTGSRPSDMVDPLVIKVMKKRGIDLSDKRPKGLEALPANQFECLITMGCEETCPTTLAKKTIAWEIPDPKGKSIQVVGEIRDLIEEKVRNLLKEMD